MKILTRMGFIPWLAIVTGFLLIAVRAIAVDVTVVQTVVNVGLTTTAVSARATRRLIVLQNYSDATIYCKFGAAAVVGEGLVLNPQIAAAQAGGAFFFDVAAPTGALNCINGVGADKPVLLVEG